MSSIQSVVMRRIVVVQAAGESWGRCGGQQPQNVRAVLARLASVVTRLWADVVAAGMRESIVGQSGR